MEEAGAVAAQVVVAQVAAGSTTIMSEQDQTDGSVRTNSNYCGVPPASSGGQALRCNARGISTAILHAGLSRKLISRQLTYDRNFLS